MDVDAGFDPGEPEEARAYATSAFLGPEGWERCDFLTPGDDWTEQSDGSWLSPDGHFRTWLPGATEPPIDTLVE